MAQLIIPVKLKGREIGPHKAVVAPLLDARSVLTNSPWTFVTLWLRRNKKEQALFYWQQAEEFNNASVGLPLQSAPLLLYYSFMNATKALLSAKGITFNELHGVGRDNTRISKANRISIAKEGVSLRKQGVLPSLA